jgi:hypothetical protein
MGKFLKFGEKYASLSPEAKNYADRGFKRGLIAAAIVFLIGSPFVIWGIWRNYG